MNVIIDTSVWIDFFKGSSFLEIEDALREGRAYVTPLVVAELLSGSLSAKDEQKLMDFLQDLPMSSGSFFHWIEVGKLRRYCQKKDINISTPDAHIAQTAIDLAGILITRDKIFAKIANLIGFGIKVY